MCHCSLKGGFELFVLRTNAVLFRTKLCARKSGFCTFLKTSALNEKLWRKEAVQLLQVLS